MKIVSHILSPIFVFVFFLILIVFHPIQWIALRFSQDTHQKVVDLMNFFIVHSLRILGVSVSFTNDFDLPENKSLIFIANHQSMFDIPGIIWYLRKQVPKFVSKKELGKGVPSISFNLRHGGACLIDRKDKGSAIETIKKFGKRLHQNNWSAAIFPEGTRGRKGVPKDFSFGGVKAIISENPDTLLVPITINNSWKIFRYGKYPLGVFSPITFHVHEPIDVAKTNLEEAFKLVEQRVKSKIVVEKQS